jgi:serine/threonine-protein kinase
MYEVLLDQPARERDSWISAACHGDDELASELRRLMAEHTETGFLDHPITALTGLTPFDLLPDRRFRDGDILCDRFRVVEFIARGGMGEVYEAYDLELHESIALKAIRPAIAVDPQITSQFKREVRRARAVSSPNVCRVNDLFTHTAAGSEDIVFLTMQLLRGETLAEHLRRRGKMPPEEALPLIRQMAAGLEAAHQAGIVHRDFKSGNVILKTEASGHVSAVITDFGLARHSAGHNDSQSATDIFNLGGTPAYMAPEQVEGKEITPATDIYALGIVAFEMVTGRLPFEGDSSQEVAVKRLQEHAPSPRSVVPELGREWETAILRCLERDPSKRFATAPDLSLAVAGVSTPKAKAKRISRRSLIVVTTIIALMIAGVSPLLWYRFWPASKAPQSAPAGMNSVAVIPFDSRASGPEAESWNDGFTEELIDTMTRIPGVRVMPRDSSFRFRRTALSPRELGKQLGVAFVLLGNVERSDGRLRVHTQMVSTQSEAQVWSKDFAVDAKDLFSVQNQIAQHVAGSLNVQLAGMQVANARAPLPNLEARDLYWMGRYYWRQRSDESVSRSVAYFEKAIARDPSFALAYSGLADAYCVIAERNTIPPAEALAKAKEAALQALALNSRLADAYVSLGQVASLYDRNFEEAGHNFREALAIDENLLSAHQWYAYMLVKLRRFDEAMRHARRALELDPLSIPANINYAAQLFYRRDYDLAVDQCRKLIELEPRLIFARLMIAQILARKGLPSEAIRELEAAPPNPGDHGMTLRTAGEVQALAGRRSQADLTIQELISKKKTAGVPASYIAIVYATLGERDRAFTWLETAYAEQDGFLSMLNVYPAFDSLRADPRFVPMLARLGINERTEQGSGQTR